MKALVLCAGLGTRLGTLTAETPKAMLPVGGEPLLAHTLRHLARHGYEVEPSLARMVEHAQRIVRVHPALTGVLATFAGWLAE